MDKLNPLSTSSDPQRVQEGKRSDDSQSYSSDTKKREDIFLIHIRATDVMSSLGRTPACFYATVEIDGKTTKTSRKPVLAGKDVVEWDEEILLPSERSFTISINVYTSFELGPRLGNGELLDQFKTTVGDVLDRNEELQPIRVLDKKVLPSRSSLRIITERRICDVNESTARLELPESDAVNRLAQLSDTGHRALVRYRQLHNQRDLDEAITYFERVRGMCPPDDPNHSAVLFSLATARFIHCQDNNYYHGLDVPITLYQDALQLRSSNHRDHPVTALDLCFALLAHLQRQGENADRGRAKDLLSSAVEGYAYRAAWLALQMTGISVSIRAISRGGRANPDDEEWVRRARAMLLELSDRDPDRRTILVGLGVFLNRRFEGNGDLVDIHEAILVLDYAVRLTPDGHPEKSALLGELGTPLFRRFERLGDLTDIDKSISMLEEAVRLTPNGHPGEPAWFSNLGSSLRCRFERLGDLADINKSILMLWEAVRLTPNDHPKKPALLNNLGNSLFHRFDRLGNLADIDESISMLGEAVHLTPNDHPHKPALLSSLGRSLLRRFERLGDLADIDKSISMFEEAAHLTPNDHPDKPDRLGNIGGSLLRRFERLGDLADIDKSISMFEEAVHLTLHGHPNKPAWLGNLGGSLLRRFERLGDLADMDKSILMYEDAVRLTPNGHPNKSASLGNLGNALARRFERLGDPADIDKSISMSEEAVRIIPNGHPNKLAILGDLGGSLCYRFKRLGDLTDIDKSISISEEVVHFTPNDHPGRPVRLDRLGNSFLRRFERLGVLADIDKSISMFEEAVRLTPNDHPDKPNRLGSLGISLLHRFVRLGDLADIDKSISMSEEAVRLTPNGHPDKPAWVSNLGNSLSHRFKHLGDLADFDKPILMLREAVRLTPNDHPDKPALLNNLGNSLYSRFECLSDLTGINQSIPMFEEAVHLTPSGHPDKPGYLKNLGDAFMKCFKHSCNPSNLSAATLHFSVASRASTGPTSTRFHAARSWISSAHLQGKSQALLDAYTTAINLLPQLAWLGLPLTERHRVLLQSADVARDAAAAALGAGCPEMAVEWLEQGRSIVWGQFLQLRTPVDELCVEHPGLADQFQRISQELEHAGSRENVTSDRLANDMVGDPRSLEEEVQRHHDLALKREKLLADIRSLPGFDRFLLPKTIKQLAALAYSGPVVYLNASRERCDALIVMTESGSVTPVPLPGISYQQMEFLQSVLRLLLRRNRLIISRDDISALIPSEENLDKKQLLNMLFVENGIEGNDRAVKVKPQKFEGCAPDDLFRNILAYLWNIAVNPILDALGFSTPPSRAEKKTRIFWCSTGPFTFLPIHAAGLYDTAEAGTKLSDFAISSYIPSLSALASSPRKEFNGCSPNIHLVAVPQPPTDGLSGLVSVKGEIDHIRVLSAGSPFVTVQDSDGTIEDVTENMKNADWVHFACHGVQDPDNPLDSGLCLADHRRLKLSDIIRLSRPQGGLAFLSACQTAQGDEKLAEESVHLAAGMLLAGYGGVIATMWSIMDRDAPNVTKDVYEHLFRDGKVPDSTEAAEALDYAVQHLRDSGASFSSWVPFIHVGR